MIYTRGGQLATHVIVTCGSPLASYKQKPENPKYTYIIMMKYTFLV